MSLKWRGSNRLLNESHLQSSAASRRLRKSQASDCDTSLRKSSSKSKRKSSSRRRKKTPEEATTQSYELFASRHLRKLTAAAQ